MRLGALTSRPALNGTQAVLVAQVAPVSRLLPSLGAARWSVRAGTEVLSIKESCLLPAAVVAVADASEFAAQHEAAALSLQALTPHQQHLPLPLAQALT